MKLLSNPYVELNNQQIQRERIDKIIKRVIRELEKLIKSKEE